MVKFAALCFAGLVAFTNFGCSHPLQSMTTQSVTKDRWRVVRPGEILMLDEETPVSINGQQVYYLGVDEKQNFVYRFMAVSGLIEIKARYPITLRVAIKPIDPFTPVRLGLIAGDVQMREHRVRVRILAANEECYYMAIRDKEYGVH